MSATTNELRRLLDERGVEWWEDAFDCKHRTIFDGENNVRYCVHQLGCVLFISSALSVTPEQAVEATLGRGTCRRMPADDATVKVKRGCFEMEFPYFECSECGSYVMDNARYCPICGAKVVE